VITQNILQFSDVSGYWTRTEHAGERHVSLRLKSLGSGVSRLDDWRTAVNRARHWFDYMGWLGEASQTSRIEKYESRNIVYEIEIKSNHLFIISTHKVIIKLGVSKIEIWSIRNRAFSSRCLRLAKIWIQPIVVVGSSDKCCLYGN
jgi:hypothetical protein